MIGRLIKLNPSAILFGLNAVIAFGTAWGLPLTQTQQAALVTIATSVLTIAAAFTTRPVGLQLIIGAVTSGAVAFGAFHLTLSPDKLSAATALLSIILGIGFHLAHYPVTAWKQGTDATSLERRAAAGR